MASYNRFMRRAIARGKKPSELTYKGNPHGGQPKPSELTYKGNPHGGQPKPYERKDFTDEGFAGELMPGAVRGFNAFTKKGGII